MQQFSIRPGRTLESGKVYSLPDELARELIGNERAAEVFDDPPHTATVETAAITTADHQRKSIQRPRKRNSND
jgi:hypothetical protein